MLSNMQNSHKCIQFLIICAIIQMTTFKASAKVFDIMPIETSQPMKTSYLTHILRSGSICNSSHFSSSTCTLLELTTNPKNTTWLVQNMHLSLFAYKLSFLSTSKTLIFVPSSHHLWVTYSLKHFVQHLMHVTNWSAYYDKTPILSSFIRLHILR